MLQRERLCTADAEADAEAVDADEADADGSFGCFGCGFGARGSGNLRVRFARRRVVREHPDVGNEVIEHATTRLDDAPRCRRCDARRVGEAAYPFDHAGFDEVDRFELPRVLTTNVDKCSLERHLENIEGIQGHAREVGGSYPRGTRGLEEGGRWRREGVGRGGVTRNNVERQW